MRKLGRNEPCPCGSGKKYKKCCGANTVYQYDVTAVNNELYKVHGELITNITENYDQKIEDHISIYHTDLLEDEQTKAIYKTGLTPWIVTSVALVNQRTIFQDYMDTVLDTISLTTRQTLLKWMNAKPSIYEVTAIDKPWDNFVKIKDIASDERHIIPYQDASDFIEGGLIIGIVVPFKGHDNFLFTMLKLYHGDKMDFINLLEQNESYPVLLEKALKMGLFSEQWLNPLHEEVADLFASHLSERGVEDKVIVKGIMLWNNFCEKVNPVIHKLEPHAAAFTYYIEKELLNNKRVKQMEIADQFGTSPSTLSTIYRRIAKEIE